MAAEKAYVGLHGLESPGRQTLQAIQITGMDTMHRMVIPAHREQLTRISPLHTLEAGRSLPFGLVPLS